MTISGRSGRFLLMAAERYERIWDPRRKVHVRVHRVVAEQALARPVQPGEVVQHVDGDKRNNTPENLHVLPSQQHMVVEHLERKRQRGQAPLFDSETFLPPRDS